MSDTLPFERVLTYAEWVEDDPAASDPGRLDVACPTCGAVLRVVADDAAVGHWYFSCPCGWDELEVV